MAAGGRLSQASEHVFVKAKPNPWPSESAMEQLFRPLYKLGDRKISPFESMLRREYSQALTGKISSVRWMLKVLRENERARALRDKRGRRLAFQPSETPPCRFYVALRVLGIAVGLEPPPRYEIDQHGRRVPDIVRHDNDPYLKLLPWAFELSLKRKGISGEAVIKRLARWVQAEGTEIHTPVVITPEPRPRDPKETRFQKGKSGNPKGRPRKAQPSEELPFEGFLSERTDVQINGNVESITRLEALLFQLQLLALKGNEQIARLLLTEGIAEQVQRWKRKEHEIILVHYENESRGDTPTLRSLEELGIIHRRRRGFPMLERWIVEEAVGRLDRELSEAEQIEVVRATPAPRKVNWPDWWLPHLREKAPRRPREREINPLGW